MKQFSIYQAHIIVDGILNKNGTYDKILNLQCFLINIYYGKRLFLPFFKAEDIYYPNR
jgi:hypothetical protein